MALIQKLNIVVFTDQDDKDDDEVVTLEIIRSKDKQVIGRDVFGQNETWDDQSEKELELRLNENIESKESAGYLIRVSKSCADGYPNGKGWHFCVRTVNGFADDGKEYKLRTKETRRVLLGKHGGDTGPTTVEFELGDT